MGFFFFLFFFRGEKKRFQANIFASGKLTVGHNFGATLKSTSSIFGGALSRQSAQLWLGGC